MNKKEVQKRILKNGNPLALELFSWDEKTKTLSTVENSLIIDFYGVAGCQFYTGSYCQFYTSADCQFKTGPYCVFKTSYGCVFDTSDDCQFDTGYGCQFKTGSGCQFKTGPYCQFKTGPDCQFDTRYDCQFDTGSGCQFKTGSDCVFKTSYGCVFDTRDDCVIVRTDIFLVVIQPKNKIKLCPYNIAGYLENIDNKWYLNGDKSNGEYIIADNILSKILSHKKNIYHVINYNDIAKSYIVTDGENYSHGKTLKDAKDSLMYKISNRDTTPYKKMKLSTVLTLEQGIKMYRVITGACERGVHNFLVGKKTKKNYSISEIIETTRGQYGNEKLISFFKE